MFCKSPRPLLLGLLLGWVATGAQAGSQPPGFTPSDLEEWERESFHDLTRYLSVQAGNTAVLFAQTQGAASGLVWEGQVDLAATPWLHWCWQVSNTYPGIDETTREGDDYPARLYVVASTGFFRWQVQALNYVWASEQPQGSAWPSAFTERAHLLALRSGPTEINRWLPESRHLQKDFARYFNNSDPQIQALAIMTDADNTGREAEAWYSRLHLSATGEHPGCPSHPAENQ
ncbi:DUF3047 domain-containing protein [Marinospirillum perlucidum]|uniref:DUF3047 domain-containing protein n=1 Tax=Marinospirillum perlucidum TaxID=1982602 RepID=UPI000DF39ACC|nr:DUF3047 domain-containing protein [Marinospirillum perlucidum]